MSDEQAYQQWVPVIGRSLAFLCMHVGDLKEKNLAERASFLEALGIERRDVALMLGTSVASITETLSKVKRSKKGAKKGATKTSRRARR